MSLIPDCYKKQEEVRKAVKERYAKVSQMSLKLEVESRFSLSKSQLDTLDPFMKYFNDSLYYAGGFYNVLDIKFFKCYTLIQVSRTTYHK